MQKLRSLSDDVRQSCNATVLLPVFTRLVAHVVIARSPFPPQPNVQQSLAALNGMQVLKLRVLNHNNKEVMLKKTAWFGRSLLLKT